jgi:hypothetical protein
MAKYHEITTASRALLLALKGVPVENGKKKGGKPTGEWRRIRRDARIAHSTLTAFSGGRMKEMRLTKAIALAQALGIEVSFTLPERAQSSDGARRSKRA